MNDESRDRARREAARRRAWLVMGWIFATLVVWWTAMHLFASLPINPLWQLPWGIALGFGILWTWARALDWSRGTSAS